MSGRVEAVHRSSEHQFSKGTEPAIELVAGLGVAGDAHQGARVRHRSRVAADPTQPNLRQVHLIDGELFDRVAEQGFTVGPGQLGENVTTRGIDLLGLPTGSVLALGGEALLAITGLRNPCGQINGLAPGLRDALSPRGDDGTVEWLAGIMAVVVRGGTVRAEDLIEVALPPRPHHRLERV